MDGPHETTAGPGLPAPSAAEAGAASFPGGVYLCQVGERVSCGACCGLYNTPECSRDQLQELLTRRTERFRTTARDADAIDDFRIAVERHENVSRPFPDFYCCPFLGWVGGGLRPGCLLHPLAEGNNGIDFRGLSFYGGLACRDYFCPTYRSLPAACKHIVTAACRDWYAYGLVITEERLIGHLFAEVDRRMGRPLAAADLAAAAARAAVFELLALKLDWPFRSPARRGLGNYFFNDGLHPLPPVDYRGMGAAPSPHDPILRELTFSGRSPAELRSAEALIESRLDRAVRAILAPAGDPTPPG